MKKNTEENDGLFGARAHTHTTILMIDAMGTQEINVPKWQIKYVRPILIGLLCLCVVLFIGLLTICVKYLSHASERAKLEEQITLLENQTSAEIDAKLKAIEKSEVSIRALEKFLKDRNVDVPAVSFEKSVPEKSGAVANAGGPAVKIAEPIPYIGEFSTQLDELLETARTMPLGRPHPGALTSTFGRRANPFTGRGSEGHSGLDIRGKTGEPIYVTADGVVDFAGVQRGYGKVVYVQHARGIKTLYAHMSAISVKKGQRVVAGEQVGKIGSTGRSTGPHLHYEVRINNERQNPRKYIGLPQISDDI